MQRRMVLLGLVGALGWREAGAKPSKKQKKGQKRVKWCFRNPEKAVGCKDLPVQTCEKYVAAARYCCPRAKQGWNAFDRCLYA